MNPPIRLQQQWIRKEKSIVGQDFENLLNAMREAYPTCKGNYIDFDVYLKDNNPVILEDIILAATHTAKTIPSVADIEKWLEEQEDLDKVFDDFLSALKTAPLTKSKVAKVLKAMTA